MKKKGKEIFKECDINSNTNLQPQVFDGKNWNAKMDEAGLSHNQKVDQYQLAQEKGMNEEDILNFINSLPPDTDNLVGNGHSLRQENFAYFNLTELTQLIDVRQYVINAVNSANIDRPSINYLNNTSILLDKKILSILKSDEFKEFVSYKDVKQAVAEVVKMNDVKASLK